MQTRTSIYGKGQVPRRHKISGAWSIEASSLLHKNELLMEFTDPSGRLEEVRITAAGRPGFGELSGWMVGFIHWAVDLRGSKCVRLNSVELLFPFSMNLWGRCNMWPNEDEVLEIALVLSELATIPGARTPNLVIFFAIQKCWQRWRCLFFMVTVYFRKKHVGFSDADQTKRSRGCQRWREMKLGMMVSVAELELWEVWSSELS